MRLSIVRCVFRKELREMLRDRRSLAVMFGLPLVLYPLLAIGIASLGESKKKELTQRIAKVVVTDPASAPHLAEVLADKDYGVEVVPPAKDQDLSQLLLDGKIDAAIDVPKDVEQRARAGEKVELRVLLDRSRTTADFVERKLRKAIEAYQRWVIKRRLEARDVPESVLTPVEMKTEDVASRTQVFGHLLGQALPVLLMMTGMLGALFPALNATTTERELGTLEALLLTPARRVELLTAKGLLVLLCGLLTAALNMLSMSMVLLRAFSMVGAGGGPSANLSVSPVMLILSYLAAVPGLIFFSAIVLVVGLIARNYREANSFATPVMLIPLGAFAVSVMDPAATPALLITPVANTTLIIRDVLTGRATATQFVLAFGSSCLYAGIILSLAARVFSSEQLVNPAWEPLSMKFLRRASDARRPKRMPAVDEALILFCLVLLLLFYVSPNFLRHGLMAEVVGNELLLILVPTLLFARLAGWEWAATFGLRKPAGMALIAAALLGAGLAPWAPLVQEWQDRLWPPDPQAAKQQMEVFVAALQTHAAIKVIIIGALAGLCEETLFRGPMQNSMLHRIPPWAAIVFTAILFSALHLDVHGFPLRAALGALLGWIAWRTGSIVPAVVAHGLYDTTALAIGAWQIHHGQVSSGITTLEKSAMAVGAVLIAAGIVLSRRAGRQVMISGA
jgi:sodium transport system permease protein